MLPLRLPQIVSIEKCSGSKLLVRSLVITRCDILPSWFVNFKADSLMLSSNTLINDVQVLKFLRACNFQNVKAVTCHNLYVSKELLKYCYDGQISHGIFIIKLLC